MLKNCKIGTAGHPFLKDVLLSPHLEEANQLQPLPLPQPLVETAFSEKRPPSSQVWLDTCLFVFVEIFFFVLLSRSLPVCRLSRHLIIHESDHELRHIVFSFDLMMMIIWMIVRVARNFG